MCLQQCVVHDVGGSWWSFLSSSSPNPISCTLRSPCLVFFADLAHSQQYTHEYAKQAHHLLNNGAAVNQRDSKSGWTPLHRAAHLAHLDGYLEIYEYLLVSCYYWGFVLMLIVVLARVYTRGYRGCLMCDVD